MIFSSKNELENNSMDIIELYKRDTVPDRLGLRMYREIMRGEC